MGRYLIKPLPERDLYVEWSTVVEAPTACGPRAKMLEFLVEDDERKEEYARPSHLERLDRCDRCGTSRLDLFSVFPLVYEQRGTIRGPAELAAFIDSFDENGENPDLTLVEPFSD